MANAKSVTTEDWGLSLTDSAAHRINHLVERENGARALRLSVSGGGCSGFQYGFTFDESIQDDDFIVEKQSEDEA